MRDHVDDTTQIWIDCSIKAVSAIPTQRPSTVAEFPNLRSERYLSIESQQTNSPLPSLSKSFVSQSGKPLSSTPPTKDRTSKYWKPPATAPASTSNQFASWSSSRPSTSNPLPPLNPSK